MALKAAVSSSSSPLALAPASMPKARTASEIRFIVVLGLRVWGIRVILGLGFRVWGPAFRVQRGSLGGRIAWLGV